MNEFKKLIKKSAKLIEHPTGKAGKRSRLRTGEPLRGDAGEEA
ncbi:hypothetical protein [Phormidium sp. CCY1219]|nr:hypothetical protein [Phormidium sp. CCY1219]